MYNSSQSLAPYVASPINVAKKMLEIADLKPGETVFDLGCGDGRILIIAAQEFGAKGVGVELNPNLVKESRAKVAELKLSDSVQIIQGDLMKVDLSQADVVTMYLTTGANEKVRPKLETELKSGARVVTHDFTIPKWDIIQEIKFRDDYRTHTIYLYNKPKSMRIT